MPKMGGVFNMTKNEIVAKIVEIDSAFKAGSFNKSQLEQHLAKLRNDVGDAREQRQSVAANMTAANSTVETNGAKWAKVRGSILTDMEQGETIRGRVKANVWLLLKSDLGITKVNGNYMIDGDKLKSRQVMTRAANPTPVKGEFHQTFDAIQLDAMREDIRSAAYATYTETQKKERTAWIRQKNATFNTALRNACSDSGIATVSMASAGTGDTKEDYFKVVNDKATPFADLGNAEQKKVAKEQIEKAVTSDRILDNVSITQAIDTIVQAYVKSGRATLNDAMMSLDKAHQKLKDAQAKEAKAQAKKAA